MTAKTAKPTDAIVDLFRYKTTVTDVISELQTGEAAAEFYVSAVPAYSALMDIWKHVRAILQTEGRTRSFKTADGKVVALEPTRYDYDLDAIKTVAPEVIVDEQLPVTPEMEQINRLAQEMFESATNPADGSDHVSKDWIRDYAEEFMRLSQPRIVEKVDGRKLSGILGRGDQRAQDLANRQVKVPVEYKITVK